MTSETRESLIEDVNRMFERFNELAEVEAHKRDAAFARNDDDAERYHLETERYMIASMKIMNCALKTILQVEPEERRKHE